MKKKLSALLCALCMAMALCLTAFAAGNPTISGTAARNGSKVTLTLSLDADGVEFTDLQFNVKYDTAKLQYDYASNEYGTIGSVTFQASEPDDGCVVVAGDVMDKSTFTSGKMVTLAFNVKEGATGDAAFTVDGVVAVNKSDADVKANPIDAIAVADPEPTVYNVNTATVVGGKVSVDKSTAVAGDTVKATATADKGYEYVEGSITVTAANGTNVNVNADGTFKMPESEVTVSATFTEVETPPAPTYYNITVAPYENGKVSVDKTTAKAGETVTVTATPDDGYVAKISVTTKSGATVAVKDAKFTMPAEDVTVTVNFEKATKPSEKPSTSPSTNPSTSPSTKPSTTNKPSNKTTTVTATATPAPTAQPKPAAAIPQTGDTANLALYAVLFVASAMALGYVVYRKKANH